MRPRAVSRFTVTPACGRGETGCLGAADGQRAAAVSARGHNPRSCGGQRDGSGGGASIPAEDDFLVPGQRSRFLRRRVRLSAVRFRHHSNAGFWPGGTRQARCFFVKGGFRIELARCGPYRLIASKGPEFIPVDDSFGLDGPQTRSVRLGRWTDMSAHRLALGRLPHTLRAAFRRKPTRGLLLWARWPRICEWATSYAWATRARLISSSTPSAVRGRFLARGLAAWYQGQEDPRTRTIGHTISLNLARAVFAIRARYYLYSLVFDRVHRLGGLTGYAHVNTANFAVYRDMSVNVRAAGRTSPKSVSSGI